MLRRHTQKHRDILLFNIVILLVNICVDSHRENIVECVSRVRLGVFVRMRNVLHVRFHCRVDILHRNRLEWMNESSSFECIYTNVWPIFPILCKAKQKQPRQFPKKVIGFDTKCPIAEYGDFVMCKLATEKVQINNTNIYAYSERHMHIHTCTNICSIGRNKWCTHNKREMSILT